MKMHGLAKPKHLNFLFLF